MFQQFRLYQDNRLKINKESRESKMAARKEGGGAKPKSAKMTDHVRLIAVEGSENVFKVEKVSIPAPAPVPASPAEEDAEPLSVVAKRVLKRVGAVARRAKTPEPESEEEDISNNPEALAAAVAETAIAREEALQAQVWSSPAPKVKAERKKRAPAPKKIKMTPKLALVAPAEDSGEETEDAVVEECD
jgi:hypothetical protein